MVVQEILLRCSRHHFLEVMPILTKQYKAVESLVTRLKTQVSEEECRHRLLVLGCLEDSSTSSRHQLVRTLSMEELVLYLNKTTKCMDS
jgi:hypothetical protein